MMTLMGCIFAASWSVSDKDDRAGKSGSSASDVRAGLESFRKQPAARAKTDDIKVWDLKEIGLAGKWHRGKYG